MYSRKSEVNAVDYGSRSFVKCDETPNVLNRSLGREGSRDPREGCSFDKNIIFSRLSVICW